MGCPLSLTSCLTFTEPLSLSFPICKMRSRVSPFWETGVRENITEQGPTCRTYLPDLLYPRGAFPPCLQNEGTIGSDLLSIWVCNGRWLDGGRGSHPVPSIDVSSSWEIAFSPLLGLK